MKIIKKEGSFVSLHGGERGRGREMSEARTLCEGALRQSAEWTLGKGFLTPVYAEGMERVFLATEIQGFLIRNRAALRSIELGFGQVHLPQKGSSRYDPVCAERHRATTCLRQRNTARWRRAAGA